MMAGLCRLLILDPGTRGHEVILANNGGYVQVGQYIWYMGHVKVGIKGSLV